MGYTHVTVFHLYIFIFSINSSLSKKSLTNLKVIILNKLIIHILDQGSSQKKKKTILIKDMKMSHILTIKFSMYISRIRSRQEMLITKNIAKGYRKTRNIWLKPNSFTFLFFFFVNKYLKSICHVCVNSITYLDDNTFCDCFY